MDSSRRIAVIGAGIAGLSCATALARVGAAVTLYEKSRGPGGRMSTRRGDNWQCDHGAQYFTARDPAFRAEVSRWERASVAAPWTPRLQVLGGAVARHPDPSVQRFVGTPSMVSPAGFLADGLRVVPQTTISRLQRDGRDWRLSSAERGPLAHRYDAVLLAIPAPEAASLVRSPAAALATLADGAAMRGCWALMLRFAAPVDWSFDAAFVNEGLLRWIARDRSKPGRDGSETWLLHATAEWSEAHLEQDADGVASEMLDAFTRLGGPAPQAFTAHRWRYADTEPALAVGCEWDAEFGLGLCGDWLNGGKIENAWHSGRQLAHRVARSFGWS
jgi:predicted NAD/FAD-dependent oxidoreductase